jgi:hypothetical protein
LNDAEQVEKVEGELLDGLPAGVAAAGEPKKQKGDPPCSGSLERKEKLLNPLLTGSK